jgi:type II secretory pathway pseudopilin PulG
MGQQQLLLVILVTVIVGIATVVAINTFGSAADSANVDAVRQDLVSMAAAAQSFYIKPAALGGGNQDFTGITFNDLGAVSCDADAAGTTCTNENGEFTISSPGDADGVSFQGVPAQAGGTVSIDVEENDATMQDYTGGS